MDETQVPLLAEILENSGYGGALQLITNVLMPLAKEKKISMNEAIHLHIDEGGPSGGDGITPWHMRSWYQLLMALRRMTEEDRRRYQALGVYSPI